MGRSTDPTPPRPESVHRQILSNDQKIVLACLAALSGVAWLYLARFADGMSGPHPGASRGVRQAAGSMAAMVMNAPAHQTPAAFGLIATMWVVMMVGMMLPSAVPMLLLYTAVRRRPTAAPLLATAVFASGYLVVWSLFAVAAAALQLALNGLAIVTPGMALASRTVSGVLLVAAGIYEFTPLKQACLRNCQGPMMFIAARWRPGLLGGLRMGVEHGLYCVGCCWALMLLLFVGGVMNLLWIVALAAIVLAQKLLPQRAWTTGVTGVAAVGAGLILLGGALV